MRSRAKFPSNLSTQPFGRCPTISAIEAAMGHTAQCVTRCYFTTAILNAYSQEENPYLSSANPGDMTDDDVRNIWLKTADKMNPSALDNILKTAISSNEIYVTSILPLFVLTDKRGRSRLPRVAVLALTRTFIPSMNTIRDKRLLASVMIPQAVFHTCTWELLKLWVQKGHAPEHLRALLLEHDLGL
jgi:hypothetical protein